IVNIIIVILAYDLEDLYYFIGIKVTRTPYGIFLYTPKTIFWVAIKRILDISIQPLMIEDLYYFYLMDIETEYKGIANATTEVMWTNIFNIEVDYHFVRKRIMRLMNLLKFCFTIKNLEKLY
ncbi:hypothetical protein ACJX0J_020287, partial [Zea mays]